ncbi:CoA transferase [Acidisphaera sp. S103]|uniref:CaiB/BaiF CoA-transferase family protein n=1 Tax=Acidisphaera sp. S103 TaxID=1747223 RepID=UPI00131D009C|nr:CoA transferase [Acidisphaera sp. S103]
MAVLDGFRVVQVGPGLAAAVCGRLFADVGAEVARIDPDRSSVLAQHLNHGPAGNTVAAADLIVCEGSPDTLRRSGRDPETLRAINPRAALVLISPFGQSGPRAEEPATDLTLFFASGIARMLTGQVDDLDEAPMRPVGEQSAFLGGLAAACAGMHAALTANGAAVDVSIHEALATLAMTELTRAGRTGKSWSRKRVADGNGATVCILPASDGYAAISPREDRQWASWLVAMGSPAWGGEARFATKKDRVANWDALHALMADWSRDKTKQWIAETAQAAHVPSFPLCEPAEHLGSSQLRHRGFFRPATVSGQTVQVPGSPFGLGLSEGGGAVSTSPGRLPLSGVRVLDFSWVIAGPTATRYLAAMGAEVIKIEAPGQGDPGRASELHSVLGQAKKAIVLDLKKPEAIAAAKALAANADVLVENFATGVMDRLGLGAEALRAVNPRLIYVSASGLGRTGPESRAVAYGTLLQCYAGFAGLNRHPGVPPRVGMAWLDPMCGLMLAFITAAALWRRRSGQVARVDFSMIEAMLWTMADPLLAGQLPDVRPAPECGAVYRRAGADDWLCVDPAPEVPPCDIDSAAAFTRGEVAAAALARSADLVASDHLRARGFWDEDELPGLPWRASFGRTTGKAPGLGADTDAVLRDAAGLSPDKIARLREAGALG